MLLSAFVGVMAGALCLSTPSPALGAAQPLGIDLPGYFDVVVDDARDRVFVSEGPQGSGVEVVDFSGGVSHINLPGATGMVLHENSLYVADAVRARIAVLDAETLIETDSISIGKYRAPTYLTLVAGRLWFMALAPNVSFCCTGASVPLTGGKPRAANIGAGTHPFVRGTPADAAIYLEADSGFGLYKVAVHGATTVGVDEQSTADGVGGRGSHDARSALVRGRGHSERSRCRSGVDRHGPGFLPAWVRPQRAARLDPKSGWR